MRKYPLLSDNTPSISVYVKIPDNLENFPSGKAFAFHIKCLLALEDHNYGKTKDPNR
jgi:hypothetical protein